MPKKKSSRKKGKSKDSVTYAFLATFLSIIGFIIALLTKKDDKYVMFYAKQSLVIFVCWVVAAILGFIPILGDLLQLFVLILWIFSWIYALSGKEKKTPIVGEFADKFDL